MRDLEVLDQNPEQQGLCPTVDYSANKIASSPPLSDADFSYFAMVYFSIENGRTKNQKKK